MVVQMGIFVVVYGLSWLLLWKKNDIVKFLLLSIIPAFILVFSGIMLGSIPLFARAVIFAAFHILISVKNGIAANASTKSKSIY